MPGFNAHGAEHDPFRLRDDAGSSWGMQLVERLSGLSVLSRLYRQVRSSHDVRLFLRRSLDVLQVDRHLIHTGEACIPSQGPLVVVANHPFGALEGMLIADLLLAHRTDVRIMANGFLCRIPELAGLLLPVDPYDRRDSHRRNLAPLRHGVRWLRRGGVLLVFPAGDVASPRLKRWRIEDGRWDRSVARLAHVGGADVLPVYVEGRNSLMFQLAAAIHPRLKTWLLPRELLNKRGRRITLIIGPRIPHQRLVDVGDSERQTAFLRLSTYALADARPTQATKHRPPAAKTSPRQAIIPAVDAELAAREVGQLPPGQRLGSSGKLEVWYARPTQIPWLLQEIGRLREISFRAVGEGTGRAVDIDLYDAFYHHLFVWHRERREVVGAYRLGLADEIVRRHGRQGLYSYSLFHYSRAFLHQIQPAIELGRSFVRPEYQRDFAPLMLLWKGIGGFVARHPRYAVLFGPVSISADYSSTSQQLLIEFLRRNVFDERLGREVRPRNPYRGLRLGAPLGDTDLESLSAWLTSLETDGKGVPILIRQYLKLGGRLLGFNVDHDFNDAIDGLIRVDLRRTDPRLLQKYLGRKGAAAFLDFHRHPRRHSA